MEIHRLTLLNGGLGMELGGRGHLSRMLKALGSISRTQNQMKTVTKKAMCITTQEILLDFWKL